jgi:hypothetical protein
MRKKRLRLALGVAALAIVVVMLALSYWRSPVTRENYERIKPGMRPSEVKAILGRPSKEFPATSPYPGPVWMWDSPGPLGVASELWPGSRDDEERIWFMHVVFDADGIVVDKSFGTGPVPPRPSWIRFIWPF